MNRLFLSDIISSSNPKGQKIYSRNKVVKPLTVNRSVIGIYKVYLVNRQTIIKIVSHFLSLNVYDSGNLITKSIEIFYYNRFDIKNTVNSLQDK